MIKKLENKKIDIRNVIIGGAKIETSLINEIQQLTTTFFETYGMTETCSHIALRQLNGAAKTNCFKALQGIQIRTDEHNCLSIKAPHLTDIELHTTDIVELITPETFRWKGRLDNIINSGGVKINPEIIEQKLES